VNDAPYTEDLVLESVATRGDLVALLRVVHLRADKPSLRDLEARTRHHKDRLSRTVVAEMLNGVRFPKKSTMLSFLCACGVRDDQLALWSRAWERIIGQPLDDKPSAISTELTQSVVTPELALLRAQVKRLDVDNERLRLELAASGRSRTTQKRQNADPVKPQETHNPIASRRELGVLLHELRLKRGLEIEQVAGHLMCSINKVKKMEGGFRAGTPRDVRDLCDLYGVTGEADRGQMMNLAVAAKQKAWWQSYGLSYETYVGLEAEAIRISAFQSSVIHGLLQTAEYARANHEGAMPRLDSKQIELQIEAKLTRQRVLTRENPPEFSLILDEAALHRVIGGGQVMAAQLVKIQNISKMPNIVVQVLPYDRGAHPALESNFSVLELPSPIPGVVYVEGLIGSVYLEEADDIERYLEVFGRLRSIALTPEDTAEFIERLSRSQGVITSTRKRGNADAAS
jgi:transcriptional regulator with XRE-family HTH domain